MLYGERKDAMGTAFTHRVRILVDGCQVSVSHHYSLAAAERMASRWRKRGKCFQPEVVAL